MEHPQERRRAERLKVSPPVEAELNGHAVRIVDIGRLGVRVEHHGPLRIADRARLTFRWDGDPIAVDCGFVRTDVFDSRPVVQSDAPNAAHTGLEFRNGAAAVTPALKRMITTLEQREEIDHLRRLVEASKLINSSITHDALLTSILSVARHELDVERGTLYFVDEPRGQIWSKIAGDLEVGEIRLPIGKGIAGSVAATGEHILLHDAYSDERF